MAKVVRPSVTKWKEPTVDRISNNIRGARTVAVVNLVNLPSRQLQDIRAKVKEDIKLSVTRKRLLKRALEKSKIKGIEKLVDNMEGMSAIICSDLDSFELFRLLKANMSASPARAGQVAPSDISIKAGPTPFSPGPILSELGEVGLKAAIEGGKVVIKEDAVVVKKGEPVSEKVASVLSRFDIKPMKIGMNLVVALESGSLMTRNILDVNVEEYINKLELAHSEAFKLAVSQSIPTTETVEALVIQAERDALILASSQDILTSKTASGVLAKAEKSAQALKEVVDKKEVSE